MFSSGFLQLTVRLEPDLTSASLGTLANVELPNHMEMTVDNLVRPKTQKIKHRAVSNNGQLRLP